MLKKILLSLSLVVSLCVLGQSQYEVNSGFTTGKFKKFYGLSANVNLNFMFQVTDRLKVGPTIGVLVVFGKEYEYEDTFGRTFTRKQDYQPYMPITAKGQYNISERFIASTNLGYAFNLEFFQGYTDTSGFYYKPSLGYFLTEKKIVQIYYSGISIEGGALSQIGLSFIFTN